MHRYIRWEGGRGKRVGGFSTLFLKKSKKCPDFGKKDPDNVYLWVKLSNQNGQLWIVHSKCTITENIFETNFSFHVK